MSDEKKTPENVHQCLAAAVESIKLNDPNSAIAQIERASNFIVEGESSRFGCALFVVAASALGGAISTIWTLGHWLKDEVFTRTTFTDMVDFADKGMVVIAIVIIVAALLGAGYAGGWAAAKMKRKREIGDDQPAG